MSGTDPLRPWRPWREAQGEESYAKAAEGAKEPLLDPADTFGMRGPGPCLRFLT
ncbi:MAG: hypothetical protein RIS76_3799 [Verrucomicrobiota bacterium]|jgi:hypothetical protein